MPEQTAQDRGREWEREGATIVGGRLQKGSGNTPVARLDVAGKQLIWSFKSTDAMRSPVDIHVINEARMCAHGPEVVKADVYDVIAYKLRDGTMRADLDLRQLLAWIREPPQLVPPTKNDNVRHTARTPPHLR